MVFAVGRSTVSHSWLAFWLVLIQNMSTLVQVMAWHQAITWTNVSQVLCCHVASQGHHELYGKLPVHHIGTVRCRYNADNILKNIHERHPIARPLLSFVDPASGSYSARVPVIIYAIFYYIGLRYNGTRLYISLISGDKFLPVHISCIYEVFAREPAYVPWLIDFDGCW